VALAAAVVLLVGVAPAPAGAQSWEVDPAFATTRGRVDPYGSMDVVDAFLLGDGRSLVVTQSNLATVILRIGRDGGIDRSYGPGRASFLPRGATLDGAGGLLVAGVDQYGTAVVQRFDANGAAAGTFSYPPPYGFPYGHELQDVAVLPGGKVLAAGFAASTLLVVRLQADLSPDPTYGTGGIRTFAIGAAPHVAEVKVDDAGRAVIVGEVPASGGAPGETDALAVRLTAGGDLDPAFSGDGVATIDLSDAGGRSYDRAGDVVLSGSTAVLAVARYVGALGDADDGWRLLALDSGGAPVGGFGGGLAPVAPSYGVAHLERDGDGFLASGGDGGTGGAAVATARFGADGRVDPAFGTGGVVRVDVLAGTGERGVTLADGAGRLLLAADVGANDANDELLVTRLRPSVPPPAAPPPPPPPPPPPAPTPAARSGFWLLTAGGDVYAFGDAHSLGSARVGSASAEDLEPTPSGNGYWVVDHLGHVFAFGDAPYLGGLNGAVRPFEKVTSLARTPSGGGYGLFPSAGRVLAFGDAPFLGDMGGTPLNGPVLDSIPTPTGRGYYLVASDGGIFTFGDAVFRGSMGGSRLNAPVQSRVPDGDGDGYWLVASDGGIFAFNAGFHGSMGDVRLNRPITGMVGFGSDGYLMVAEDGGIFTFGSARFHGSLGDRPPARPVTAAAVLP
jgi:hypothetical protein